MFSKILTITVAAIALLAVAVPQVHAKDVPLKGSGRNSSFDPATGDFYATGVMSHLGKMTGIGNVVPVGDFIPEPGVFFAGTFAGSQVFIAADGSVLEADLQGEVLLVFTEEGLVTGTWSVSWDITGGTGRFFGATASTTGAAINPPFNPFTDPIWAFDWFTEGTINLAK